MAKQNFWDAISSAAPAPLATAQPSLVPFGPMSFEPRAEYQGDNKALYTFDQAQASVARRSLALPTFRQVMELVLIPLLEDKLDESQKAVARNMLASYGEWNDTALYRQLGVVFRANGIQGLIWNADANAYDARDMMVDDVQLYAARNLEAGWNPLKKVAKTAPELVADLYSRPFDNLPRQMRENAGLYLPPEDVVRPVGRGGYGGGVGVDYGAGTVCSVRAARGAKKNVP